MASAAYSMDVSGHQRSMWGGGWGDRDRRTDRQITRQDTQVSRGIAEEFIKSLKGEKPISGFELLAELGILAARGHGERRRGRGGGRSRRLHSCPQRCRWRHSGCRRQNARCDTCDGRLKNV